MTTEGDTRTVSFPEVTDLGAVPTGDMPGDKVQITQDHVAKAQHHLPGAVAPAGAGPRRLPAPSRRRRRPCGGSGVGKSETGSLLAYCLNAHGVGAYVLTGDNYPRRIPSDNDAERLRTFRVGGTRAWSPAGWPPTTSAPRWPSCRRRTADADPKQVAADPWLAAYQKAGREGAGRLPRHVRTRSTSTRSAAILAAFHDGAPPCASSGWDARWTSSGTTTWTCRRSR